MLISLSCAQRVRYEGRKLETPPGTVRLNQEGKWLFADECEISNLNFLEYLYWNNRQGISTSTFPSMLFRRHETGDSTLLIRTYFYVREAYVSDGVDTVTGAKRVAQFLEYVADSAWQWWDENTMRQPAYRNHPVTGITREDAAAFCRWRSDRVFEMMLDRDSYIRYKVNDSMAGKFTRELYLTKGWNQYKNPEKLLVPVYRLPTVAEWQFLVRADSTFAAGKSARWRSGMEVPNTLDVKKVKWDSAIMFRNGYYQTYAACAGRGLLKQLQGNVSEMTMEPGVAMGGNFMRSGLPQRVLYNDRRLWLGFRCVCEMMTPDEYLKLKQAGYPW